MGNLLPDDGKDDQVGYRKSTRRIPLWHLISSTPELQPVDFGFHRPEPLALFLILLLRFTAAGKSSVPGCRKIF